MTNDETPDWHERYMAQTERLAECAFALQRLRYEAHEASEAFYGWEACSLAAQTDPEEVQDADDLWTDLTEKMRRLATTLDAR